MNNEVKRQKFSKSLQTKMSFQNKLVLRLTITFNKMHSYEKNSILRKKSSL